MASYAGPLTENILFKLDPTTKAALARQAECQQLSLSALTRQVVRNYLAALNQAPAQEESHGT